MKNYEFLYENFQFLEVKFSIYLNRRVFIMKMAKKHTDVGRKYLEKNKNNF